MERSLPIDRTEARRRLRAAVQYGGYASFREVEEKSDSHYTARAWGAFGNSRRFGPKQAREAVRVFGVPYEWFTVPDLAEAVRAGAVALGAASEGHEKPRHPKPPK